MNTALILSSVALGLSIFAAAAKFVSWLIHTEPRTLIRFGRWLLLSFAIASIPSLFGLIAYKQWTLATSLGAAMLIAPTLLNWRSVLSSFVLLSRWLRGNWLLYPLGDFAKKTPPSPELALRAAMLLEEYLTHVGKECTTSLPALAFAKPPGSKPGITLTSEEALEILGLAANASAAEIHAAHCRLLRLVHPDNGGTNYLLAKINEAKEILQPDSLDTGDESASGFHNDDRVRTNHGR